VPVVINCPISIKPSFTVSNNLIISFVEDESIEYVAVGFCENLRPLHKFIVPPVDPLPIFIFPVDEFPIFNIPDVILLNKEITSPEPVELIELNDKAIF
jgi:hypothetical protein